MPECSAAFIACKNKMQALYFFFNFCSVSSPKLLLVLLLDVKCKNIQLTFRSTVNFIMYIQTSIYECMYICMYHI